MFYQWQTPMRHKKETKRSDVCVSYPDDWTWLCACIFCPFQARVRLSAVATGAQSSEFRLRTVTPNAGRAGTMGTS